MLGIVIYLIIQIALAGFTIHIFVNREEIRATHAHRKDKPWEKIVIVILVPLMSFGYSLLGGYPPKSDQLVFTTVCTVFMYGAMILRWRRQARIGTMPPTPPAEPRYYYRSTDGTPCGPDTEARLSVLARMGFITIDTPIADEGSPEAWKPLRERPELTALHNVQAA
jgi:hypothetical protein